jgi:SAM-dependent methyltransferase
MRNCSVCLATGRKQVGEQLGWTIWECSRCAFHYATPGATAKQPDYSENYFDAFICRDDSEEWRRFYKGTLDTIRRNAPGLRLLDAGSGASRFGPTAGQEGWHVTAVDGSSAAIKYLNQNFDIRAEVADLNKRHALVTSLGEDCKFDAVNSFHVIEHLANPDAYLAGIYDCLVPSGCLHLGLPIYPWHRVRFHEALFRLGVANHHFNLGIPDHIAFFDTRTIRLLLKRIGFRVQSVERSAYTSIYEIARGWSSCGALRRTARGLIRSIAPLSSRVGFFNHIIILAKKG